MDWCIPCTVSSAYKAEGADRQNGEYTWGAHPEKRKVWHAYAVFWKDQVYGEVVVQEGNWVGNSALVDVYSKVINCTHATQACIGSWLREEGRYGSG